MLRQTLNIKQEWNENEIAVRGGVAALAAPLLDGGGADLVGHRHPKMANFYCRHNNNGYIIIAVCSYLLNERSTS